MSAYIGSSDTTPYHGRDHSVPCQEIGCRRMTFDDDALCARHKPSLELSPTARDTGQPVTGDGSATLPGDPSSVAAYSVVGRGGTGALAAGSSRLPMTPELPPTTG